MSDSSPQQSIPEILSRGVEQILPSQASLAAQMAERKLKLYMGIDPTGNDLTLGHSVALRKMQQFADQGHHVILLIGNGTVRIGDPTGRDTTRPELTDDTIQQNFQNWQAQASKVLNFDQIEVVHNGDWLDQLTYQDIVKLLARTTVQQLLERDMFQDRMKQGQPIYGHEVIYPMLQGYDSVHLDVDLEIGGTDQLFNMMMGRQLQKSINNRDKWVLTTPIINGTDGRKMSKSYGNYIALTEEAPQMYGKLMSIADDQIVPYFTLLTDVPMTEIEQIKQAMTNGDNPLQFKKQLAKIITAEYHDAGQASAAEQVFENTVQNQQIPEDLPTIKLTTPHQQVGQLLQTCLPEESNSQLRRLVEQGAVALMPSEKKLTDFFAELEIQQGQVVKIGKRRYFKVVIENAG